MCTQLTSQLSYIASQIQLASQLHTHSQLARSMDLTYWLASYIYLASQLHAIILVLASQLQLQLTKSISFCVQKYNRLFQQLASQLPQLNSQDFFSSPHQLASQLAMLILGPVVYVASQLTIKKYLARQLAIASYTHTHTHTHTRQLAQLAKCTLSRGPSQLMFIRGCHSYLS